MELCNTNSIIKNYIFLSVTKISEDKYMYVA